MTAKFLEGNGKGNLCRGLSEEISNPSSGIRFEYGENSSFCNCLDHTVSAVHCLHCPKRIGCIANFAPSSE
jgi:hypothetical protein